MDMDDSISMMSWTQEARYSGAKQETKGHVLYQLQLLVGPTMLVIPV
jgi:hypothetical protein